MKTDMHEPGEINRLQAVKIKWRQHEIILITAVTIIIFAGYLWQVYHTEDSQYASPFINSHTPFSLYKNILLPDISVSLSAYLAYLWLNLYIIPHFLFPKKFEAGISKVSISFSKIAFYGIAKKVIKKYAWLFIQLVLIVFILGTILNIATYYRHQWLFNYPGFSIFFNKNIPNSQLNLSQGFFHATAFLGFYGLYVCIREIIIDAVKTSRQSAFNISICNRVTSFVLQLICTIIFLKSFNIIHENQFYVSFSLYIPALFAMFISNVYWLFPMKGDDESFFSKKIIIRLLCTSFVYSIPLVVFIHEQFPIAFLYSWAEQLFIVTPLTWWYYQTNKEKILQLRIVETALVKSKADLQFLRSQINPHFLFNALNTLYGTALQENAERTAGGIQKLGDMMRFMLHENNLDFIQMDKEIEYLKNYIALQKLRTQSSPAIIIEDNISEQNCDHKIAPMLLIPLVENAFKHGISLKEKSWIKINLECSEKKILFEVHNSMHEKLMTDTEQEKSGIGYKNVLERLKLIYPGKFDISVNGDGKEFFVKLVIQP